LDRLQGNNHVPDAGSTLAMLGMALSALGGMARLRAVCF
jgi:protein with PEP-CTERM/exosortase system signal